MLQGNDRRYNVTSESAFDARKGQTSNPLKDFAEIERNVS